MQTIFDDMDPIDPLTMDDYVMAERIHSLVRRTLNECNQQDSDQSVEQPALENSNRPFSSRLPSIEPTTSIAKSTTMVQGPQWRSVHFPNLEEIREERDMTREDSPIDLQIDHPSEEALGLSLFMYQ